jgi:ribosomal RNA-processing protein 8
MPPREFKKSKEAEKTPIPPVKKVNTSKNDVKISNKPVPGKKNEDKPQKDKKGDKMIKKFDPSRKSPFFDARKFQKRYEGEIGEAENGKSQLHQTFEKKIEGSKFRMLNETLYTTSGVEAKRMFEKNPELFDLYHKGYVSSVKAWPKNPLDAIIKWLGKKTHSFIVGDFGCGEGKLAESVKQTVHSFDLLSPNERVTACDISHVPLKNESLDIAVYCLSLMGTNWMDYLLEANRVLKTGGILKIAEVESRFIKVLKFQDLLEKFGFEFKSKIEGNGYFILFEFVKKESKSKKPNVDPKSVLKPCLYKKR